MDERVRADGNVSWTRARLLRAALGGGAVVAGGTVIGARSDSGTLLAAQPEDADAKILNFFLMLEYVQEGFYRAAVESKRLTGEVLEFASTVGRQETEHVALLTDRLGSRARARPASDFGDAFSTPKRFRDAAIQLEDAAIGGYIGQASNLSRDAVGSVATLISVEARQVAWIRDLAGLSPAPRAADPAGSADTVVAGLRTRGFIA
jgi:hypothetical protein